jgi:DNA-binding response OmpR family regulator
MAKLAPGSQERKFILAVDDMMSFLNVIADVLGFKYDVGVAQDLLQAIRIIQKRHIDMLILDEGLPNMMGTDFLKRLRKLPSMADVPVLIISATVTVDVIAKASALGVSRVMSKPVDSQELLNTVNGILR